MSTTTPDNPTAAVARTDGAALSPREPKAADRYREVIEKLAVRELVAMAGEADGRHAAARFALAFRQAGIASPDIQNCTPQSVGQALALSLLTDLAPGGPMPGCYLIPRRIKGVLTLTWQASWRGLQTMAARAHYRLRASAVYEGDAFRFRDGIEQALEHVPADEHDEAWEHLRGVWVVSHEILPDGRDRLHRIVWMPRQKIEKRRAVSESYRRFLRDKTPCPWTEWPEEQALKTGIRYAISRGAVELDTAGRIAYEQDGLADRSEPIEAIATATPEPSTAKASGAAAAVRQALGMTVEDLAPAGEPEEVVRASAPAPETPTGRRRKRTVANDPGAVEPPPEPLVLAPPEPREPDDIEWDDDIEPASAG